MFWCVTNVAASYVTMTQPKETSVLKHILSSALATTIAKIATLPICTIKTNYQNNVNNHSIRKVIREIYLSRGIFGFYNASLVAIASQVLSTTSKYTWYRVLGGYLSDELPQKRFLVGGMAGVLGSLMTHPFDVVKIHLQMRTPMSEFREELRRVGPSLFYRAYSKTLYKSVVGSVLFFPLYDTFNERLKDRSLAAFCSAMISTVVMQPFDYAKTRNIYCLPAHPGKAWWKLHMYFKGVGLNLARVVPHFVIVMTGIEFFRGVV
jgi:hypothetical protein